MNTMRSFDRVIDTIKSAEEKIDRILATGDISQDGSVQSYANFIAAVERLDAPYSWLPGNHDDAQVMSEVTTACGAGEKQVRCKNWLIILLDTSAPDQVHGYLTEQELGFLASALKSAEQDESIDHCLICLHHNPIPGNAEWMRDIGLHNSEELFEVLGNSSISRALIYGHIHQDLDLMHNDVRCFCTPSTCIQFKPEVSSFTLDENSPGYRTLKLYPDGSIESEVYRITADGNRADLDSGGY